MPLRVQVVIPAVEERRSLWERMLERIPEAHLELDVNHTGIWPTWQRIILKDWGDATHLAIVQDDMLVCADFNATLQELINYCPCYPFSLFYSRFRTKNELVAGSWFTANYYTGPALVIPRVTLKHFYIWVLSAQKKPGFFKDACKDYDINRSQEDYRFVKYIQTHNIKPIYTKPSLAFHAGDHCSTQISPQTGKRIKYKTNQPLFIGENVSGLTVDWSLGVIPQSFDYLGG